MYLDVPCINICACRHFDTTGIDHSTETAAQLFSVPDFVGDACKAIASRVRGAVASVQFDDFHKVRIFSLFFQILYNTFDGYLTLFIAGDMHMSLLKNSLFMAS